MTFPPSRYDPPGTTLLHDPQEDEEPLEDEREDPRIAEFEQENEPW